MRLFKKFLLASVLVLILVGSALFLLAQRPIPEKIVYGMSFNTLYAEELGLNWKETYDAILTELQVKHLRLAAHWPMVEPQEGIYNFSELDYQVSQAQKNGADIVMAVGRRLPRWPECHIPQWVQEKDTDAQQKALLDYITVVVNRYKNNPAITYWQIENEPYLGMFAKEHCGEFDEAFFEKEIAHFRSLDATRPFLITDSGNLGTWAGPYAHGDAFGTSVYVHFWNPELGQFRTILPPWAYRVKTNIMGLLYGKKETMLIELSAEPWLLGPIIETDIATQYSRMDLDKFNDILEYAKQTRFEKQYLWGAEWWWYLKKNGHTEMWERGKQLFVK